MKRIIHPKPLAIILWLGLLIAFLVSISNGPLMIKPGQTLLVLMDAIFSTSFNSLQSFEQAIVMELRVPRTLLAIFIGCLLGVCGCVTQGLFRNPLADPGIIGVSSGAGLGAAIAIVLLPISIAAFFTPIAAFAGGLITTLFVYRLAQSNNGTSVLILLLAGVAIGAFTGAAIGLLTYSANDQELRDLTLWGMGSLNGATYEKCLMMMTVCIVLLFFFTQEAENLNALLVGESEASHLGINVEFLKIKLIVLIALGIGIGVAASGIIGFISLVIPHLIRMLTGPNHKTLIPLSALCGAVLLLIADIASRVVVMPGQLPVGLMTAVFGAPFFTYLLIQQRRQLM